MFRLRFPEKDIPIWAARFGDDRGTETIAQTIRPSTLARGYLLRNEFLRICDWKTPRCRGSCQKNTGRVIETVTRAAFSTHDEALKINLLQLLDGVGWPTASTILYFGDERPYPILDYRALWSLGYAHPPTYTTPFWLDYVVFTRELAERLTLPIRVIDKALWQYSKERQR